jgi:hypothetical protein
MEILWRVRVPKTGSLSCAADPQLHVAAGWSFFLPGFGMRKREDADVQGSLTTMSNALVNLLRNVKGQRPSRYAGVRG